MSASYTVKLTFCALIIVKSLLINGIDGLNA